MRNLIVKLCHRLLAFMGLAGAFSCDGGGLGFIGKDEYGTPHCNFEVKCKVIDSETKSPVKGVVLTPGHAYSHPDENGEKKEDFFPYSAETSVEGAVEMKGTIYAGDYDEIHIRLTDPDPAADGHYRDTIYVVPMEKIKDAEKGSHWNAGTFGADVTLEAEQVK